MANYCSLDFEINCSTKADADKLNAALQAAIDKADAENSGTNIGSERYLFSPYLEQNNQKIILSGDVRWSLNYEEAADVARFLCSVAEIDTFSIFYHEPGCILLGRYEYENGTLNDCYVPDEFYPEYDFEKDDCYPILENAVNEHGIEVFVDEIAA